MLRSLRGAGRFGLALGMGVAVGVGGAWVAALADPPAQAREPSVKFAAQKATKKKMKGKKGAKADEAMPKEDAESPAIEPGDDKSIKFSRDIAPVLVGVCIGCHNPKSDNPKSAALDLTTFEGIMKGTAKRKVILAGKPDDSPLILRIRGDEQPQDAARQQHEPGRRDHREVRNLGQGRRHPRRQGPRRPDQVVRQDLRPTPCVPNSLKLTPAQRVERIETVARERWKKISPDTTPETTQGTHFALFSVLPKERATALVKQMDAQWEQSASC